MPKAAAERNKPDVRQANEARAGYLNIERILAAAKVSGDEAIHPGYGP
ncbi:MAG: hypothetical protein EXR28_06740 [Betaproteobacteria bacterium]|nr:hypothetical protein [Betaproteobacteria bacterium]